MDALGLIWLLLLFSIPILSFVLIFSAYKLPIKYLEKQHIEVTAEVKRKIRNNFLRNAIIVAVCMVIFTFVGFGIGMIKYGSP